MTSAWVYDTATTASASSPRPASPPGPAPASSAASAMTALGRPVQVATTVNGATYTMGAAYDANSRLSQVSYPSGLHGRLRLQQPRLCQPARRHQHRPGLLDRQCARCREHLLRQTAGNGLVTTRGFDPATGRLTASRPAPAARCRTRPTPTTCSAIRCRAATPTPACPRASPMTR